MIKKIRELYQREFIKNVFTLISGTSAAQGIAILIYFVLTRIYTPYEHGIFNLYLTIIALTAIISTGKYESAVMMPGDNRNAINLVALSSLLSFVFSLFLLILIAFFHHRIAILLGDPQIEKWLWFVPLSTVLVGVFQTFSYWSARNKRYGRLSAANVVQSLSISAIKVSTSKLFLNGGGLIIGTIGGQIVGLAVFIAGFFKKDLLLFKEISISGMRKVAREYSLFPRFSMIHNLVNNFSSGLPVFIITSKFGAADAGLYALGFMMINRPVNLVTYSFTQVLSQRIIGKYNQGQKIYSDVKRMSTRLFQIAIIPFFIAGFAGPSVFSLLFGEEWSMSGKYMQILLPWIFVVLISSPLSFLPDMLKRQRTAMWLDIIKICFRVPALLIGVYFNNIYLAVILFSLVGTISVGYNLYWYLYLARKADLFRSEKGVFNPELPANPDI